MEIRSQSRPPPNPSLPHREDCWSEGETSALVDAWGGRFLDLNRGNLRQKQWQQVALAVNSRPGCCPRPPRTDVQCKNRIDTLKKKYKSERAKVAGGVPASNWLFYPRLDLLIGSSAMSPGPAVPSPLPPLALPLPKKNDFLLGRNYAVAAAAAAAEAEKETGSSSGEGKRRRRRRGRGGMGELAGAIEWFAGVYERMEGEKQRQVVELEKERMKFVKGLELQRMQMFLDTQVRVEKIKLARRSDDDGQKKILN